MQFCHCFFYSTNVVNLTKTGTSKKSKKAMAIQTAVRSDPMSTTTNQLMQDNLSDTGDDLILRLSDDEDIDCKYTYHFDKDLVFFIKIYIKKKKIF